MKILKHKTHTHKKIHFTTHLLMLCDISEGTRMFTWFLDLQL